MLPHLLPVLERAGRLALRYHGFRTEVVPTSVGDVHAYVGDGSGSLPTVVLLHPMAGTATPFAQLMLRLRPHVQRLIALDMPGHGFSATPTSLVTPFVLVDAVAEAIAHFGSEPSIVVGNSLGGGVALQLAVDDPSRVAALALLSPAGARIPRSDWDELVARFQVESKSAAQELMGSILHRPPWYLSAFTRDFQAALQSRAVQDVLQSSSLDDAFEPHQLRNLSMPIFLMWGQSERILPHSAFEFFCRHLPHHTQIERPHGFGHCPHLDDPDRLAVRLLDFMRHALRNQKKAAHPEAGRHVLRPASTRDWRERRTA